MAEVTLSLPGHVTPDEARLYLALKLYETGKLSLGKAAEMTGHSHHTFLEILGKNSIPAFRYAPEELEAEVQDDETRPL